MTKLGIDSDRLRKDKLISLMEKDLTSIKKAIENQDFSGFEMPSLAGLVSKFEEILLLCNKIEKKADVDKTKSLLRIYLFVIDRHKLSFYSAPGTVFTSWNETLQSISKEIGPIPRLNSYFLLPGDSFLPQKMPTLKKEWQQKACQDPVRGNAVCRNEIHFIKKEGEIASGPI